MVNMKTYKVKGSGCGPAGTVVTSDTRDPQFESSHWQILFSINCIETVMKRQNEEQRGRKFSSVSERKNQPREQTEEEDKDRQTNSNLKSIRHFKTS